MTACALDGCVSSAMEGCYYLFGALLALSLLEHGHSQCRRPPFWLFSLPEDVQPIFSGLTAPFMLVDNGTVLGLLSRPDENAARLIGLPEHVSEFPAVACVNSKTVKEVNYTWEVTSMNETILTSYTTLPTSGVFSTRPFRFRAVFNCSASSNDVPIIVGVKFNLFTSTEVFCQIELYVANICGPPGTPTTPLNVTDGFIDQNFTFKDPPTEETVVTKVIPPTPNTQLTVVLPGVLVSLFLALVLAVLIVFIVWGVWYRKKSKQIAEFHPESVSLAYQGVYSPWVKRGPHEKELPREKVHIVRELGEGAFGVVYQAVTEDMDEEHSATGFSGRDVAVKQLREGSGEVDDFFREVDFMSKLDHPHVVKLVGVCSVKEPFCMIFEYMDLGDLCNFLRQAIGLGGSQDNLQDGSDEEPLLTKEELLSIASQISEGMVYISGLGLVHRDLATRNCLVASGLVIKIGDFGMSRSVNDSDYYRVKGNALLPVRWMAPESILYGKFTMETDVWAYGILLWEIFTFGQQPYSGLTNEEVIQCVQKGGHCEPPDDCPAHQLMFKCWEKSPKKRPNFEAITTALQELINDEN